MGAIASQLESQLESIVGAAALTTWDRLPPDRQTALGAALQPGTFPDCVVAPRTVSELAEVVAWAAQEKVPLLPCGQGSKLAWGGLAEGIRVVVSTERLTHVLDHAVGDMVVTAEAGVSFAALQAQLATHRQFISLDPAYGDRATLGGIVATADAGALRQRYGGVRDLLIGLSLVRCDGKIAKAGGKVVKNVAGYDLMKLMTGSYGSLGILSQLTFRTYPLPDAAGTAVLTGNGEAIAHLLQALLLSSLTPTAIELLAPPTLVALGLGQGLPSDLGLFIRFQSIAISVEQQLAQALEMAQAQGLKGDRLLPSATDDPEASLWKQLRELWDSPAHATTITCKIGVRPSQAVALLTDLHAQFPLTLGTIHAGSGLGTVAWEVGAIAPASLATQLQEMRDRCQTQGGFLSILQASPNLKHQLQPHLELWGVVGNSLPLMQDLKQRFDPQRILSPGRFVGQI